MGVITDFFIAPAKDIANVLSGWKLPEQPALSSPTLGQQDTLSATPCLQVDRLPRTTTSGPDPRADPAPAIDGLPNVQCNCMLPDKVAILFAWLAEISTERALELLLLGYLTGPPESEITVQMLPSALMHALANAQAADLAQAARILEDDDVEHWGYYQRHAGPDLTLLLHEIQTLARQGLSTNSQLFLWTCT